MLTLDKRCAICGLYTVGGTFNMTSTTWADFTPTFTEHVALDGVSESAGVFTVPIGLRYLITANIGYEQYSGNNRQAVFMRVMQNVDGAGYSSAEGAATLGGYSRLTVHGDDTITQFGMIDALSAETSCLFKLQYDLETASRLVRSNDDWGTVVIWGMNY